MALAPSTIRRDAAEAFSKAMDMPRSSLSAINDHEPWGAFDYARSIADEHQNPAVSLPGRHSTAFGGNLPAHAFISDARLFHSVNVGGSKRLRSQTIAHDHLVNSPVGALHLSQVLSKSSASMTHHGAKGKGRVPNSTGELHRSKGEFPNVGC